MSADPIPSPPAQPRLKRRWYQFSLKTLFALIVVASVLVGVVGVRWFRDFQFERAVQAIRDAGGVVVPNEQQRIDRVYLGGLQVDDDKLKSLAPHLARLPDLKELDLVGNQVTDAGLAHLKRLGDLRELYIFDTQVTPAGLRDLQQALPQLAVRETPRLPKASSMSMRKIYDHAIPTAAISPDGKLIAAGSADGTLRLWDTATGDTVFCIKAHDNWLFSAAFSPDGELLATGGGDNLIKLWNVRQRRLAAKLEGHDDDVHALVFSPDGHRLVSVADDRKVKVWDVECRAQVRVLKGHTGPVPGLALSADGRTIASASRDDTVRVWNLVTGDLMHVLEGHTGDVMSVAFSPDGGLLASASYDETIRLWQTETGDLRSVLRGHTDWVFAVQFRPDGGSLVSGGGDGLRVWNPATGEQVCMSAEQRDVSSVAFGRDGEWLVSASACGNICLRDPFAASVQQVFWSRYGERGLKGLRVRSL